LIFIANERCGEKKGKPGKQQPRTLSGKLFHTPPFYVSGAESSAGFVATA
jgi:hypothetical protein